jgi:hypothetical protein
MPTNFKNFTVDAEFEIITFHVRAKNKRDAKKKAMAQLKKMNPARFLKRDWRTHRVNGLDIELND